MPRSRPTADRGILEERSRPVSAGGRTGVVGRMRVTVMHGFIHTGRSREFCVRNGRA